MPAEIRRENLKTLLKERFAGKIADMARAIDRDDAYLWQLLNASKHGRQVGERIARHIEAKLNLGKGALDVPGMVLLETLKQDEAEMLRQYRRASPSWRIALRYLGALRGDVQDEVSQSVNMLLAKVSMDHAPDARVEETYGKPPTLHEPARPPYVKKKHD